MSVTIRLATVDDAETICQIYAPIVRDTHISFEQDIPPTREIAKRISKTMQQYPWLICCINREITGYAYASAFRARRAYQWTAETTVYVHPAYQRRGIARGLYESLMAILRAQGYCNVVGVIALPNSGSIRVHESVGFRRIGILENIGYKAGDWRDTGWWQLQLRPMLDNPQPPTPITCLAQTDGFDDLLRAGLQRINNFR